MADAVDGGAFLLAERVARAAADRGVPLRLLGGQAVRLLCPAFPPRARQGQDMDFASVSSAKGEVMEFLSSHGFQGDKRFNTIHGDRQMYFVSSEGGTSVDVIMDRRVEERRRRQEQVPTERRREDRRQRDVTKDLQVLGWTVVRSPSTSSTR